MGRRGDVQREVLLAATEEILFQEGFAALSTRRIATEANVNQALVHYYFQSLDDLCAQVLERVSNALISRQKEIFSGAEPFAAQWDQVIAPLRGDRRDVKIWVELSMMAVNHPHLKKMMFTIDEEWVGIIQDAFERQWRRAGADAAVFPSSAYARLTLTFLKGLYLEHALGLDQHHEDLLRLSGRLLESFDGESLAYLLG